MVSHEHPESLSSYESISEIFDAAEMEYAAVITEFGAERNPNATQGKEKLAEFHADRLMEYVMMIRERDMTHEQSRLTAEQSDLMNKYLAYIDFLKSAESHAEK